MSSWLQESVRCHLLVCRPGCNRPTSLSRKHGCLAYWMVGSAGASHYRFLDGLSLENSYQLSKVGSRKDVARRARIAEIYPYSEAAKLDWVAETKDQTQREAEVCRVLRIASIFDTPQCRIAARKSDGYDSISSKQRAWVLRCHELAEKMHGPAFDLKKLQHHKPGEYAGLTKRNDGLVQAARFLQEAGVRLIIVPMIVGSKIDGVMFWLDRSHPVIALSVRGNRVVKLWFTLFHEIVHVTQGYRQSDILDIDILTKDDGLPVYEKDANRRAAAFLIPPSQYSGLTRISRFSEQAIYSFASQIGVHPSIVLGRLQYDQTVSNNSTLNRAIHERASEFYGFDRTIETTVW